MLRDCPHIKQLWHKLCPHQNKAQFFSGDSVKDWIAANLESATENWNFIFPLTLWWIWKWRNQLCFRNVENIPLDRSQFILDRVEETKIAFQRDKLLAISSVFKSEIFIRWSPPPYGWIALNTDGAARGCPGLAGAGGIMRDSMGECIGAFSSNWGVCTAMRAELLALKQGLSLAWERQIQCLDVRMDNKACVQIFNNESYIPQGSNMQLIKACQQLIHRPQWLVVISHCYREANKAADFLANLGISQTAQTVLHEVPCSGLIRILEEDVRGVAWPRLVPS